MAEYIRSQYNVLKQRIEEPRKFMQVIMGPRQVGKSTLVRQVLRDMSIPYSIENADGVDENDTDWISSVWESARTVMNLRKKTFANGTKVEHLLVIDEIQKIKNWSEVVKAEWDADTLHGINLKVVLLGSSRLMIRKGLTESLAGRFELIRMCHWDYKEMRDAFGYSLYQYIYYGGYPGPAAMKKDERRWKKYELCG